MAEPADVTVIMPAYRAAGTIARALHSIAQQTVRPRAVVVVDDGSDDGTVEATNIPLGDVALTVITQPHAGAGAARNRALAAATTEYVAFLDADDEWLPEKLAVSLAHLSRGPYTFVAHDMLVESGGSERRADCARHHPAGRDAFSALFRRGYVATSTVVARRDAVTAAGGFDATLLSGQDYELWLRLAATPGVSFVVFPGAYTRYHVTRGSITRNAERRRAAARTIVRRHIGALRGRTGGLSTAVTRSAIIAFEAASELAAGGRSFAAAGALLGFVPDAIGTVAAYAGGGASRGFAGSGGARESLSLLSARSAAEESSADAQARNRTWWERLPMTYAAWSSAERVPQRPEDFRAIRQTLLGHSPYLRERYDFARQRGARMLDLGCGSGVLACVFAEHGADVTAVDITEAGVQMTRRSAAALGCEVGVARMDAEALALRDGAFDYVFSWGVLHHTRNTEPGFREAARVLKPGGAGLVMVYHTDSAIYYLLGLYWLIVRGKLLQGDTLRSVQRFFTDGYYPRHFTRATLRAALTDAGVRVDRVTVTQMQKKILPGLPGPLDRWLKARFGWLIIAEFTKQP